MFLHFEHGFHVDRQPVAHTFQLVVSILFLNVQIFLTMTHLQYNPHFIDECYISLNTRKPESYQIPIMILKSKIFTNTYSANISIDLSNTIIGKSNNVLKECWWNCWWDLCKTQKGYKIYFCDACLYCSWWQALLVGYFWLQAHAERNASPQTCL